LGAGTSSAWKICSHLECFPLVVNLSHDDDGLRIVWRWFYFCVIGAGVFPPWHCVNTKLNASDQQTNETAAFIEALTLADDQIIKCIYLAATGCYLPS